MFSVLFPGLPSCRRLKELVLLMERDIWGLEPPPLSGSSLNVLFFLCSLFTSPSNRVSSSGEAQKSKREEAKDVRSS
jgi:hypothetical protein